MFSSRLPDLAPNRLAETFERLRAERRPVIDLTESNPTRAGFDYPRDLLASLADARALTYTPEPFGLHETRAAVAADYGRRHVSVSQERVVITASTSEAYSLLFKVLCDSGDEVLTPRPSYPLFEHLTRLDSVVSRPYDLDYHGVWSIDLASIERRLSDRARALLLVTPNNPTGSFVKTNELESLARMCAARDVAIVADEVFADYAIDPRASESAAAVLAKTDVLAFSLGGLSKSVGLPQVKLGWIAVAGPERLVQNALSRLELACDTYLSVSTPAQVAAPMLLEIGAGVRRQIQSRVSANYELLKQDVSGHSSCRLLHAEGGWYAVLQVPTFSSEEDLVLSLLTEAGVLVHPGYFFDFARESFLVLSLIVPEQAFREGTARIFRHLDCSGGRR
jgi:aspartate/methionine/tyrosine aminotransferase